MESTFSGYGNGNVAAGTGLNLTASTQVINYDRWWNPAVEVQATDRAYRIGQNKKVLVLRYTAPAFCLSTSIFRSSTRRTLPLMVFGSSLTHSRPMSCKHIDIPPVICYRASN